jgi:CRP/FNR family transcriptional regulator, cyclic AMP receptor protein
MDAQRLRAIPLFSTLSKKEAEQVARWTDEVDVPAGKHLVEQGRFAHEFFAIESGTAEVLVDGEKVAELGPGDFFGEIALLEHQRRTATVTATSPITAIAMHERDFHAMAETMPAVCDRVRAAVRERLAR